MGLRTEILSPNQIRSWYRLKWPLHVEPSAVGIWMRHAYTCKYFTFSSCWNILLRVVFDFEFMLINLNIYLHFYFAFLSPFHYRPCPLPLWIENLNLKFVFLFDLKHYTIYFLLLFLITCIMYSRTFFDQIYDNCLWKKNLLITVVFTHLF